MATEFHRTRMERGAWHFEREDRAGRGRLFLRRLPRLARFVSISLRVLRALVVVSATSPTAAFAYLYSHYSKIVDERLATGYLTSRAGMYAAPRVLRAGQKLTSERLAEILRRAGYVEGEARRVWSG